MLRPNPSADWKPFNHPVYDVLWQAASESGVPIALHPFATADLPGAWTEKMKKYLGITPPDDARGCLQDIHWSGGAIGYFPTYTLGNLYAAQFFEQARKDLGDLDAQFARGEFSPLLAWLRKNIHRHGKRYLPRQLVKNVTGADLSAEPLLRHLRKKAEVYGI